MTQTRMIRRRATLPGKVVIQEELGFESAEFMEALVAAYSLIAHADGEVSPTERRRLMLIARTEPRLSFFSHEEVSEELAMHEANYLLDVEVATEIALEKLDPLNGQPAQAKAVVDACRLAIVADGTLHPSEIRVLTIIRQRLGLPDVPAAQ
jgi:tellurite resistance protein TerB